MLCVAAGNIHLQCNQSCYVANDQCGLCADKVLCGAVPDDVIPRVAAASCIGTANGEDCSYQCSPGNGP